MPRSRLERIRDCIRRQRYDLTGHAVEEMAEDDLDILDVEHAVLTREISRSDRSDARGVRYVCVGLASDQKTPVAVVGSWVERDRYLIITVYQVS